MNTQSPPPAGRSYQVRITGKVQYRIGDGQLQTIPVGQQVEVENAIASMALTWTDPDSGEPISAGIAKSEFEFYVAEGAIELLPASA